MDKDKHNCDITCSCGCDGDMPTITLTLEDDSELECNVIGTFDFGENDYIALVPVEGDEAIIYRFTQDDEGNMSLALIECDEEFQQVSDAFYNFFGEDDE